MKNILSVAVILCAMIIISLSGCKKGEDDPLLSLMSRDARITGTWKLVMEDYSRIDTRSYDGHINYVITQKFDGTTMIVSNLNLTESYPYSRLLKIEKHGIFTDSRIEKDYEVMKTGHWWWNDGIKNKNQIQFSNSTNSFNIDRLTKNELILTLVTFDKDSLQNGTTDTWDIKWTMVFAKE